MSKSTISSAVSSIKSPSPKFINLCEKTTQPISANLFRRRTISIFSRTSYTEFLSDSSRVAGNPEFTASLNGVTSFGVGWDCVVVVGSGVGLNGCNSDQYFLTGIGSGIHCNENPFSLTNLLTSK